MTPPRADEIRVVPANASRWPALESLFGDRGACGGCWCMHWRLPAARFEHDKGAANRASLRALVAGRRAPGVLAIAGREPIGWCSIGPRRDFVRLERARTLAPIDDAPVWSVVCFFIARSHRGRGLSTRLLEGAVDHAARHGATIVEGYPHVPKGDRMPDAFAWCGLPRTFLAAGFDIVASPSPSRHIMRRTLS